MLITYLGHAGFVLETDRALVVADPWLSGRGAYESSWMQLPQNHHLAPAVRELLARRDKELFVYISHAHQDHFDKEFFESLCVRDFTAVVPCFRRPELVHSMERYGIKRVVGCADGQTIPITGGYLKVFVEEAGLNRDSSLLIKAAGKSFLNLNDCKMYDRLERIAAEEGPIDAFTAQFSGAIWHPTSYEYEPKVYAELAREKMLSKFEAVARSICIIQPRFFLASAGPACFLDPELIHLNFEPINIFPRAPRLFEYLANRRETMPARLIEPMPGDVFDVESGTFRKRSSEVLSDATFEQYVRDYADRVSDLFSTRRVFPPDELSEIFARLRREFERKLDALDLHRCAAMPLYAGLTDLPGRLLRIDFQTRHIGEVECIRDDRRYTFTAHARDVVKILDGSVTWEELLLSFRIRLSRKPDEYCPIIHGFLASQVEDLAAVCDTIRETDARLERGVVEVGGKVYSVRRYCPHQGADLLQGWVEGGRMLVCPRHRWKFDLQCQGRCTINDASLCAELVPSNIQSLQDRAVKPPVHHNAGVMTTTAS